MSGNESIDEKALDDIKELIGLKGDNAAPTDDEINETFPSPLHFFYMGCALRAILKNDEERARNMLGRLTPDQLQDLEYACNWLGKLAKEIFFEL